jgi:general secretion pathway protein K
MNDNGEEGIALIAVLWVITLLSVIAAALSFETHVNAQIARNGLDSATARAAADAGIERAILDLLNAYRTNNGTFHADGTVYYWPFAESVVHISIRDEFSKVNLNQAPEALLAALFTSVGIDQAKAQSLADAIADFRDPDDQPRANGAETAQYRDAGLAWGPKNQPFETIEELQQVLGMTPTIYNKITPDLTVYTWGTVNPTLASARVTAILKRVGFQNFVKSQSLAYSIRAEAKNSNGATFVREAIAQISAGLPDPVRILSWQVGATTSPPEATAAQN